MKAYIIELDERLKQMALNNQKLNKKYSYSKQKNNKLIEELRQLQYQLSEKISMYKQKIQAYDKLVNKLTV